MPLEFQAVVIHWQCESNDRCVEDTAEDIASPGSADVCAVPEFEVIRSCFVGVQDVVEGLAADETEDPDAQHGDEGGNEDRMEELSPLGWNRKSSEICQNVEC